MALGRTVAELDASLSASELMEWMAFYELEPFGPIRDNMHAAQIASLLYNVNRRKNSTPMTVTDFMYKDVEVKKEEETRDFLGGLRSLAKKKHV